MLTKGKKTLSIGAVLGELQFPRGKIPEGFLKCLSSNLSILSWYFFQCVYLTRHFAFMITYHIADRGPHPARVRPIINYKIHF